MNKFIVRVLVCAVLVKKLGHSVVHSWKFSGDLDYSIEQEYMAIKGIRRKLNAITKDCDDFIKYEPKE